MGLELDIEIFPAQALQGLVSELLQKVGLMHFKIVDQNFEIGRHSWADSWDVLQPSSEQILEY